MVQQGKKQGKTELNFLEKRVVGVTCFRVTGFGMKVTLCMSQEIATSLMEDFVVQRMEDMICSIQSGGGSQKIATCPGINHDDANLLVVILCFYLSVILHRKQFQ